MHLPNNLIILRKSSKYKTYNYTMSYVLYFDGCCKGNPGIGGAGAVIYLDANEIWTSQKFVGMKETNNSAEYSALIGGLEKAVELNITNITIKGDSQLVIKHMKGEYKVKSSNLIGLYEKAKQLANKIPNINYVHIPRAENSRADFLANCGVNERSAV